MRPGYEAKYEARLSETKPLSDPTADAFHTYGLWITLSLSSMLKTEPYILISVFYDIYHTVQLQLHLMG